MARNPLRFNQSIPNLRPNLRASDAAFAGAGAKEAALARGAQDMANAALAVDRYQTAKAERAKNVKYGLASTRLKGETVIAHEVALAEGGPGGEDYEAKYQEHMLKASSAIAEDLGLAGDGKYGELFEAVGTAGLQPVLRDKKRAEYALVAEQTAEKQKLDLVRLSTTPDPDDMLTTLGQIPAMLEANGLRPGSNFYEQNLKQASTEVVDAYLQGVSNSDILSMRQARELLSGEPAFLDNQQQMGRIAQMDKLIATEENRIRRNRASAVDDYVKARMNGEPAMAPALGEAAHVLTPEEVADGDTRMAIANLAGTVTESLPERSWAEKEAIAGGTIEDFAAATGLNPEDPMVREAYGKITSAVRKDDARINDDFAAHALDGVSPLERAPYGEAVTAIGALIAGGMTDDNAEEIVSAIDGLNQWRTTLDQRAETHGTTSPEFTRKLFANDDAELLSSVAERVLIQNGDQTTVATMVKLAEAMGDSWEPFTDDMTRVRPELAQLFAVVEYGPGDDSDAMLYAIRDAKRIRDDNGKTTADATDAAVKARWDSEYDKRLRREPAYDRSRNMSKAHDRSANAIPDPSDSLRTLTNNLANYLVKNRGLSPEDAADEAISMTMEKHYAPVGDHMLIKRGSSIPQGDIQLVQRVLSGGALGMRLEGYGDRYTAFLKSGGLVNPIAGILGSGEGGLIENDTGVKSLVVNGGGSMDPADLLRHDNYALIRDTFTPPDGRAWTQDQLEDQAEGMNITFINGDTQDFALGYIDKNGNARPLEFMAGGKMHLAEWSMDDVINAPSGSVTPIDTGFSGTADAMEDGGLTADDTARVINPGSIIPNLIASFDRRRGMPDQEGVVVDEGAAQRAEEREALREHVEKRTRTEGYRKVSAAMRAER